MFVHIRKVSCNLQEMFVHLRKVSCNLREMFVHLRKVSCNLREMFVDLRKAQTLEEIQFHPISCDPSRYKYDYIIEEDYGF